jgi:hypothetical protein
MSEIVKVSECDYLEEDKPIRGQEFCCLSFISPDDVIVQKELYFQSKYLETFSPELGKLFDNLANKYPDDKSTIDSIKETYGWLFDVNELKSQYNFFLEENSHTLEKEYLEKNNFQTTVRGIKVRGSYDTLKEAQIRSEVLKRLDNKHNIYIGQVGCWLPFNPNAGNIDEQKFDEDSLNTLMKKYNENLDMKEQVFLDRKEKFIQAAALKLENTHIAPNVTVDTNDAKVVIEDDSLLESDPWVKRNSTEK